MKKIIGLFLLLPFFASAQNAAEEKGIHFEHSTFAELLAKAKKENKMVFVDAFTTWCGPCKWMAKNTFPNDTVGQFYNKNFINAKIDMEKGEGIDLAKKYEVGCYPTLLFIDGNGNLVHRQSGGIATKEFIALGNDAMTPAKQYASLKKKYDAGNMPADELGNYVLAKANSCMPAKDEIAKYFPTQPESALTSETNWKLLSLAELDPNSREFKYLMAHKADYEKLYNPETVTAVIRQKYLIALNGYIKSKDKAAYGKLRQDVLDKKFSFSEEMTVNTDMSLYYTMADWDNYAKAAVIYADKFAKDNAGMLNNLAWNFYEKVENKEQLAKAEAWAKHSVELSPGYANCDTYASILYKNGKKAEAKAAAEKAIELAKKEGQDYKETEALLRKIDNLK